MEEEEISRHQDTQTENECACVNIMEEEERSRHQATHTANERACVDIMI